MRDNNENLIDARSTASTSGSISMRPSGKTIGRPIGKTAKRLAVGTITILVLMTLVVCVSTAGENNESGHGSEGEEMNTLGGENNESGGSEGEESNAQYGINDQYDETRNGVQLVLDYNSATNAFEGTATNVGSGIASQVRVEIHLSNGTELGPTPSMDLSAGESIPIHMPAGSKPFSTWGAHPEVGPKTGGSGS